MIELPKLINKAELARQIGVSPAQLINKLKGTQRNSFTDADKEATIRALQKAIKEVEELHPHG
jgi:hypothetical protein